MAENRPTSRARAQMRVAVTGAGGRLGRALVAALGDSPYTGPAGPIGWTRADFDLDLPDAFGRLLDDARPEVVVHAAAWTDVDGCARQPELAHARNAGATRVLADGCAARGIRLVVISTNEVFDGRRRNGNGYVPSDPPNPINAYGASKLDGERAATAAFADRGSAGAGSGPGTDLAIVRTAWLYGPPGNDFPSKIVAAAKRARFAGEPLRLVVDETGSPTYAPDLAEAIADLLAADEPLRGTYHIVNAGRASRADWARAVLRYARVEVETEDVPASTWQRASTPPAWAVLEPSSLPEPARPLRTWQEALADYMPVLLRASATLM